MLFLDASGLLSEPGLEPFHRDENTGADPDCGEPRLFHQFIGFGQADAHLPVKFVA